MRCKQKEKLINNIKKCDNWDMLDNIEEMFKKEPKYIEDFIKEMLKENYGHLGHNGEIGKLYYADEVVDAFEMTVRRIYIEIGNKLTTDNEEYINHWCNLFVEVNHGKRKILEELDIWISEQSYLFDSRELAWVVFNIWCGKVTFRK